MDKYEELKSLIDTVDSDSEVGLYIIKYILENGGKIDGFLKKHKLDKVKINLSGYGNSVLSPSAIKNNEIPAIDRLGIQNDSYALCKAGFLKANLYLDLLKSYQNETNAIVWEDIASNLISFERLIWDQNYLNQFDKFCINIYSQISKKIN